MEIPRYLHRGSLYIHRDTYEGTHPTVYKLIHLDIKDVYRDLYQDICTFRTNYNETIWYREYSGQNTTYIPYELSKKLPRVLCTAKSLLSNHIIDVKEDSLDILQSFVYVMYKSTKHLPLQFYNYIKLTPNVENIAYYDVLPENNTSPVYTLKEFLYYRSVINLYYSKPSDNYNVECHLQKVPIETNSKRTPIKISDSYRRSLIYLKTDVT